VRDSGHGIAREMLPKVFEPFVQGKSTSLDRAEGGLGIGLTVVKGVVELHGGQVSVHSDGLGHGSEFVIRLPLATEETSVSISSSPPAAGSATAVPLRVLVVDDNPDAARLLGAALEFLGCSVTIVHDGTSTLALLTGFSPDCVLLDIGLPDIDGYEVARRFRKSGATARLVAVTGYGQDSDRLRTREAGFDEHLVKPADLAALRGVLARCRPVDPIAEQ
jgi:CheY-like chemotaxis protein